MKEDNESTH